MKLLLLFVAALLGCGHPTTATTSDVRPSADPVAQQVLNLHAFAKLYGYVRYFHPSDEAAETDWTRFAVYGAARVMRAKDQGELRSTLSEIFAPIAPTVQILAVGEAPQSSPALRPARTEHLQVVAWQHIGHGSAANDLYHSKRTNRALLKEAFEASATYPVAAAEVRRGRCRLGFSFRSSPDGEGACVALRTQEPDGSKIEVANRFATLSNTTWQSFVLEGTLPPASQQLEIAVTLIAPGRIWLDQITLECESDGSWRSVLGNGPELESDATGWLVDDGLSLVVERAPEEDRGAVLSLGVDPRGFRAPLFDQYPKPGEVTFKEIGAGLAAWVPLALWSDADHTLGSQRGDLQALRDALAATNTEDLTRPEVRVGAVVMAWNVFQHFYSYFDVLRVDWHQVLDQSLAGALADQTLEQFDDTLDLLVHELQDGHGSAYHVGSLDRRGLLPWYVELVEDQLVVTAVGVDALRRGDIVHRIDGRDAREVFEHEVTHNSGSLRFRRWVAGKYFGEGVIDSQAMVEIERDGQPLRLSLTRGKKRELPLFDHQTFERLDGGIWYVDLNAASSADIAEHIEALASAPGVVFDLRVYPYRGASILEHLLPQDDHHNWMFVPRIIYPDRERLAGWSEIGWSVLARKPRVSGKLVFLTSGRAVSAAESLLGFVEGYHLGEVVGEATAGANGNVDTFDVPGGFQIRWTGMKVLKHDGSQQHLVGILPTVPATPTIQGIRHGRDEILEKAVQLIMKGQ